MLTIIDSPVTVVAPACTGLDLDFHGAKLSELPDGGRY